MMKGNADNIVKNFIPIFLFFFMLLIFGPTEIFFANSTEFVFKYMDFFPFFLVGSILASVIIAWLTVKMKRIGKLIVACFGGIAVSGYCQIMFLNKNLDLLGSGLFKEKVMWRLVVNAFCWLIIIIGGLLFAWRGKIKGIYYISGFLLAIQMVTLVTLLITSDKSTFTHSSDVEFYLDGTEQYTVSADENIIVLVLDGFENNEREFIKKIEPGIDDFLHDFTYYDNADCNYYGTYPSMIHMFSGNHVNMELGVRDWVKSAWASEKTIQFYDELKEKGYRSNFYTVNIECLTADIGPKILSEHFDNVTEGRRQVDVFYKRLFKTMLKMSLYRMVPDCMKDLFYTNLYEYEDIITYSTEEIVYENIMHQNYDFYAKLKENGIKTSDEGKYFTIEHLMGTHDLVCDENCNFKDNATEEETIRGNYLLLKEYLEQLKACGCYDNSTIIITADHGSYISPQEIFYIKHKNEKHDMLLTSDAPISHDNLLPTIAEEAGLDHSKYGESISAVKAGEVRERIYYSRGGVAEYPLVNCYTGKPGNSNVYIGYIYRGRQDALLEKMKNNECFMIPMVDSFF